MHEEAAGGARLYEDDYDAYRVQRVTEESGQPVRGGSLPCSVLSVRLNKTPGKLVGVQGVWETLCKVPQEWEFSSTV